MTPSAERGRSLLSLALMLAIVLGNAWLQCAWGDRTADCDGLGNDGTLYAYLARDLPGGLKEKLPWERLQRLLPSAVVWAAFEVLDVHERDNETIIRAFRLWNAACLVGCVLLWHVLGNCLRLGQAGRWFGFLALFLSYAFALWTWYYPVLTDTTTLLFGLMLAVAVVRRSLLGMTLVTLVGSFVSSTFNLWTLPLFLMVRAPAPRPVAPALQWRVRLLALVTAVAGAAVTLYCYYVLDYRPYGGTPSIRTDLFPLSVLALAVYLGLAYRPLLAWQPVVEPRQWWRQVSLLGLGVWVLINVAVKAGCEWLQPGGSAATSAGVMMFAWGGGSSVFIRGTVVPLLFVVTHLMFFGPVLLVLMLRWGGVSRRLGEQGLGLVLFIALLVLFSPDSESRHLYLPLPLLIGCAARHIDQLNPRPVFWAVFAGLTVAGSMTWLALRNLWLTYQGLPPDTPFDFGRQYIGIGPWFPLAGYPVFGILGVIALAVLAWTLRPRVRPEQQQGPATQEEAAIRLEPEVSATGR
jgi:hypothetical protein